MHTTREIHSEHIPFEMWSNGIGVCVRILLETKSMQYVLCCIQRSVCCVWKKKQTCCMHMQQVARTMNDEKRRRYNLNCIVCGILSTPFFSLLFRIFHFCVLLVWIALYIHIRTCTHTITGQIFP